MARRHLAPLAACARIAAMQYGVIAREQAVGAGLSPDAIDRLLAAGTWRRVRPGVYALWIPTEGVDLWRHRLMAAALWLGQGSAVSHRAAGLAFELDAIESAPFEFATTGRRRSSGGGLVLHRVRLLPASDVLTWKGIAVTRPARTIVDLASVIDGQKVERALESALRRGLVTLDEVRASLAASAPTHRGRGALREILDGHPGRATDSDLETLVWQLLRTAGLRPVRQYRIEDAAGNFIARPTSSSLPNVL